MMFAATTLYRMGKPRLQVLPVVHVGLFTGSEQRQQTCKRCKRRLEKPMLSMHSAAVLREEFSEGISCLLGRW